MAKATHVVVHKKLYLAVDGKLEKIPCGTEVTFTAKQAEKLLAAGKIAKIGEQSSVDLTKIPGK